MPRTPQLIIFHFVIKTNGHEKHFSDESRQLPQLAWTSLLSLDNNSLLFNEPRNSKSPRGIIVKSARFQQP